MKEGERRGAGESPLRGGLTTREGDAAPNCLPAAAARVAWRRNHS